MGRYVVNGDWAPGIAAALTPPIVTTPTASWWGWAGVQGHPGNRGIPVAKPGVHSISPSVVNQPSWVSPDLIFPSLYRSDPDVAWRHVPSRIVNWLPVPARNLFNMAGVAQRSRRMGGRHQVAQPGVTQVWPDLLGRITNGRSGGGSGPLPPRGQ